MNIEFLIKINGKGDMIIRDISFIYDFNNNF